MAIAARVLVSLFAAILISKPWCTYAQSFESVGIRAQGLGGAFVAVADDATAVWWNPAGLATGPYFNSVLEYDVQTDLPGGAPHRTARGIALATPVLGFSYYRLPLSGIGA